jgi:hypothetical protein
MSQYSSLTPGSDFYNQSMQAGKASRKPQKGSSAVPYAAIISGALQLAESNQAAYRENNARIGAISANRSLLASLQRMREREGFENRLQESELRSGQKKQLAGFTGARQSINVSGHQQRQEFAEGSKQSQANLEQSIVSSGLLGTTAGTGQVQGLQAQTQRQLASIDAELAQAISELGLAQGAVEAGQSQQLVGFLGAKQARQSELEEAIAQTEAAIAASKKKKVKGWKKVARYAGVDPLGLVDPELSQFGTGGSGLFK